MCSRIGCVVKQQGSIVSAVKLTCRSWQCAECAPRRRLQLINEAKEGMPNIFLTLTCNPGWFSSPEERAQKMVWAWRIIRRRAAKKWPNFRCEFMAVFEATKHGEPHLHIVCRSSFIPQRWISAQMAELIGAPVIDIRAVRSRKRVAEYVSKYISKRSIKFGTLKRYWRSMGYLKISRAEKRRRRNEGARFWVIDMHWKGYLRWVTGKFEEDLLRVGKSGFEFEWWADSDPPLCITAECMGSPRIAA